MADHHYVPRWCQKRFLPAGKSKLYYLDLRPETVIGASFRYTKKAVRLLDPAQCFCVPDLYQMRFGRIVTDSMEKVFFGNVDGRGAPAIEFMSHFDARRDVVNDAYRAFVVFLSAQLFRTPRGLDWLRRKTHLQDQTKALMAMQELFQVYAAMWMEGIWEFVYATNAQYKFILSDNPVTFVNRRLFPGENEHSSGDDLLKVGTRTIFPVGRECCLIITHLQMVRNPWGNPLAVRENAREFGHTMANLTAIQAGRELEDDEVLRINHMLKKRSDRYIASESRELLYPEDQLPRVDWAKLDEDWFLLPNPWKVGFTTGIRAGFTGGRTFAMDEYGRNPGHPRFEDGRQREAERGRFENARREWAKRRSGKSLSRVHRAGGEDEFADRMMREYLQQDGRLPREEV